MRIATNPLLHHDHYCLDHREIPPDCRNNDNDGETGIVVTTPTAAEPVVNDYELLVEANVLHESMNV